MYSNASKQHIVYFFVSMVRIMFPDESWKHFLNRRYREHTILFPGKSLELKCIPKSVSGPIQKKFSISFMDANRKKIYPTLSETLNADQFFNPNEYEVGIIRIENCLKIILISE